MGKNRYVMALLAAAVCVGSAVGAHRVNASDHDDGETDIKSRNTNLTDLYVFNEKTQNPSAQGDNLIFVMNLNPRSLPRQTYFYNTNARYEFHVSRVGNNADTPTGKEDVVLRFEFDEPDNLKQQSFRVTAIKDGKKVTADKNSGDRAIMTTPLGADPLNHFVCLGDKNSPDAASKTITVFAGGRQDPFFFDVERFFRVRGTAVAIAEGKAEASDLITFREPGEDFALGYNVLSIVARVPRQFLQGDSNATTFDVWETISIRQPEIAKPLTPFPSPGQTPYVPDPDKVAPQDQAQQGEAPQASPSPDETAE